MRGSTNLSRFSGKTPHVYCGRESCHASMALSRWVATRANQRATATGILLVEMSCHTLAQSICKWKAGVSYGILPYFFGGTYQPRQSWPDDPQFFLSRWWSTELVTWTGRATCCRTDRASACSARTAIYKLQVAKFASPWQVLLSSSLRQYHSDSSTFKLHGARYEVQTGSRHTFWNWGSTRKEGKKNQTVEEGVGTSASPNLLPCSRRRVNLKLECLWATAGFKTQGWLLGHFRATFNYPGVKDFCSPPCCR